MTQEGLLYAKAVLLVLLAFQRVFVEAVVGDEKLVVEARNLAGDVLWSQAFRGGISGTSVADVKRFAVNAQFVLNSFELADGVEHIILPGFQQSDDVVEVHDERNVDQTSDENVEAALLRDEDDRLSLEVVLSRARKRNLRSKKEVSEVELLMSAGVPVVKLSVQVVPSFGCFSEKGWGVVRALLQEAGEDAHGRPDELARLLGGRDAAAGRRMETETRGTSVLRLGLRAMAHLFEQPHYRAAERLPRGQRPKHFASGAAAFGLLCCARTVLRLSRSTYHYPPTSQAQLPLPLPECVNENESVDAINAMAVASQEGVPDPIARVFAMGLIGGALATLLPVLNLLENTWARADAVAAARPLMDSVAALFFAKQGLRAPWAPSWELLLAEWKKNMDFVGEFRAQVSRMQYYTTDQPESEAEKATRAGKTEKLPRVALRRELKVEAHYRNCTEFHPGATHWHLHPAFPDAYNVLDWERNCWTQETHHHFDSVLPFEDGHGRARYIPSREMRMPSEGLDFDGNIVPEDLRRPLRRVDAVSGVPWFGLPAGDEEDRVGGGVRRSGLGDASWLPVGEPRLFHGLHLAAFQSTIMEQQVQLVLHERRTAASDSTSSRSTSSSTSTSTRDPDREVFLRWSRDGLDEDDEGRGTSSKGLRRWAAGVTSPFLSNSSVGRSGEPGPDVVVLTSAVPEYPRSPRKDQSAYWEAYPCDYVLVHFARNRDASLLAEYTVAADRRNGIIWRMRLFRPAWAATVNEGGEKNPQLMQDNVLRVEKKHEQ